MTHGKLRIKILHGTIVDHPLHNLHDGIDHPNLYFKAIIGHTVKKSPLFHCKTKNPTIDYEFDLDRTYEDKVTIQVWNKTELEDREIGEIFIEMGNLIHKSNVLTDWFIVNYKKKEVGQMYLDVRFEPEMSGKQTMESGSTVTKGVNI
jgi:Ca2+-dependent lipid-binding protein